MLTIPKTSVHKMLSFKETAAKLKIDPETGNNLLHVILKTIKNWEDFEVLISECNEKELNSMAKLTNNMGDLPIELAAKT